MFEVEEQKKAIVGAYGIRPVFHIVNDMKGDRPVAPTVLPGLPKHL